MKIYQPLAITVYCFEEIVRTSLTLVGPGGDVGDDDFSE